MGVPLSRIPEIRRLYGEEPNGHSPIDFDARLATPLPGHVIACRITAENPESGFQVRRSSRILELILLSGTTACSSVCLCFMGHFCCSGRVCAHICRFVVS